MELGRDREHFSLPVRTGNVDEEQIDGQATTSEDEFRNRTA